MHVPWRYNPLNFQLFNAFYRCQPHGRLLSPPGLSIDIDAVLSGEIELAAKLAKAADRVAVFGNPAAGVGECSAGADYW
jgi:hypothetical protein